MGLFSKKYCDLCGAELGLLGGKKLADGRMCKACTEKMSRWVTDRREFTVAEMAEHLNDRQENCAFMDSFRESARAVCENAVVVYDEADRTFLISRREDYRRENPDVLSVDQIVGVVFRTEESISDRRHEEPDTPPFVERRYSYCFGFDVQVDSKWFSNIRFQVNTFGIEPHEADEMRKAAGQIDAISGLFEQMGVSVTAEDQSTFGYENILSGNLPPEVIDPMSARPRPRPEPAPRVVPPAPGYARPAAARPAPAAPRPAPAAARPVPGAARPAPGTARPGSAAARPGNPGAGRQAPAARAASSDLRRPGAANTSGPNRASRPGPASRRGPDETGRGGNGGGHPGR